MPPTKFRGYISHIDYTARAAHFTMITIADVPRLAIYCPESDGFQ